jgi:hypothetical protein
MEKIDGISALVNSLALSMQMAAVPRSVYDDPNYRMLIL